MPRTDAAKLTDDPATAMLRPNVIRPSLCEGDTLTSQQPSPSGKRLDGTAWALVVLNIAGVLLGYDGDHGPIAKSCGF